MYIIMDVCMHVCLHASMYVCIYVCRSRGICAAVAEFAPGSRKGKGEGVGKDILRSQSSSFGSWQLTGPGSFECKRVINCKGLWHAKIHCKDGAPQSRVRAMG